MSRNAANQTGTTHQSFLACAFLSCLAALAGAQGESSGPRGTPPQPVTIAQFRAEYEAGTSGATIYEITGVVNANNFYALGRGFSLQDRTDGDAATRGVTAFDPTGTHIHSGTLPALGATVTVTGTATNLRGLVQIQPTQAIVDSGGSAAIAPRLVAATDLADATESVLLQIAEVQRPAGTYQANTSHTLNSASGSFELFLPTPTAINMTTTQAATVDMFGIGNQETTNSASHPATGGDGYRLLAREEADLPVALSAFALD